MNTRLRVTFTLKGISFPAITHEILVNENFDQDSVIAAIKEELADLRTLDGRSLILDEIVSIVNLQPDETRTS